MKERNTDNLSEDLTFSLIVEGLLSQLKPRPKEILVRRFGLEGKKPQVLDKIGKDFGITRERVRQIERDSFKKLQSLDKSADYKNLIDNASEIVKFSGGFCERQTLKEGLKSPLSQQDKNQLMFILNSSAALSYNKGSLAVGGFWYIKDELKPEQVIDAHSFIVKFLKEKRSPFTLKQIYDYLADSPWQRFFENSAGENRLQMILMLSREVEKNILGQWGIKNWRLISERGTREKSFLILKKYKKPLHFVEITDLINQHWQEKKALPQTVHNELIKDKRFILVGRGIYGLRDWGFDEGTVKEIIVKLLKNKGDSLEKDEIIDYVMTKKKVKKTTVLVNLADRNTFLKNESGQFRLNISLE